MATRRKVPLRKCLVTQELKPKEDLIRIVKTKDNEIFIHLTGKDNSRGAYLSNNKELSRLVKTKDNEIFIDPTRKVNGRGVYLSYNKDVILKAQEENKLAQAFKMKINTEIYDELLEYISDKNEKCLFKSPRDCLSC